MRLLGGYPLPDGRDCPVYVVDWLHRDDCLVVHDSFASVGPAVFCGELAEVSLRWTLLWLDAGCGDAETGGEE